MYKTIRKKVASSVSEIERTEDFAWGKWLKEPSVQEHIVESFQTSLLDTSQYNSWIQKPSFQKSKFDFKEIFIFPENKNIHPRKSKTHTVFFTLIKTEIKKLKLFDKEFKFLNKPEKVDIKHISVKLKDVDWNLPQARIEKINWELKSDLLKNKLVEYGKLTAPDYKKDSKIAFETLNNPLKIYKVKLTSLDKIKLSKIYYLKNISLHDVRILREMLSLINKPEVQEGELKYFILEDEEKIETLRDEFIAEVINSAEKDELVVEFDEETDKSIEQQMSEILSTDIPAEIELIDEEPLQETKAEEINENKIEEKTEEPIVDETVPNAEEITKEPEEARETEPEEAEDQEEVNEEEYEKEFESLYSFQEEGAEFLSSSKRAVLFDEMGLGKTVQVVSALKNHFTNEKIKSAVIVCELNEIGSRGKNAGEADGWLGHFHQRTPELKIEAGDKTLQERRTQWKNLPEVLLISYDHFFFDMDEGIIESKEFKKNVCFVFDEIQNIDKKNFNKQKFLKTVNSKYLWATSSYPEEEIKEKLDKVFKEKHSFKSYLGRKRKEVENDFPGITWENKWLSLDDEQVEEYKEAFETAKEKVQWFLESGNPLRFNANVFTLVHQLKQVCNFSEKKGSSRKTEFLLEQVNRIAKNHQKAVIFSQYDKAGIKKIEEVLKKNKIKFISYAPGMSTKEMETVLKNFSGNSSVTALVTGVKPSRIKIPAGNISYVIHFDVWWNPASLWQTEEAVTGSLKEKEKQSLNIYSYLMKDTIEERIHSLLYEKGFLNKSVMETVNPDSLTEMITNPEWLKIFDIPDEEYKQKCLKGIMETEKKIDSYSTVDFAEKCRNFLTKLGYKNLSITENNENDLFEIRGIYKKVKYDLQMCTRVLPGNILAEDEIKVHLADLKEITNNGKFFLITKGNFETNNVFPLNEALIDRNLLAKYFYQFIIT
jgi:SNF2 family DNA or RNA helicase